MAYFWLIIGFVLLFFSGNWLVRGSVQLARHFKISTLVIGLTVVAFGTSAPELFVSLKAAYTGVPDIAIGNVIGSNIANIGLILGMVAILMPIKTVSKGIWFDWVVMMVSTILLMFFAYNGTIGFWEGAIFLSGLILYILWSFFYSRAKNKQAENTIPAPEMKRIKALAIVLISIIGLYYGAEWLVKGAREIALTWGVSDRVIGISIVAFGTSVPELATSLAAILRKENDISVGNIIGSNIFNVWAVLGATAVIKPLPISNPIMLTGDILWNIAFAILLLVFLLPLSSGNISRWKGGILFALYFTYIYLLFN